MKTEQKKLLLQKGWLISEIEHAEKALEREPFFVPMLFWCAVFVVFLGNVLASFVLIPFLIALESWILYMVVALLAIMTGAIYTFLITDIGLLERKHHLVASVMIPLLGLGNMVVVALAANRLIAKLPVATQQHNPLLLGIVFGMAFLLP